jgi:hypothetical protein
MAVACPGQGKEPLSSIKRFGFPFSGNDEQISKSLLVSSNGWLLQSKTEIFKNGPG